MVWMLARPPGTRTRSIVCEVGREVLGADGFEHLDRDDGVEGAADLAVVLEPHLDAVGEAGLRDTLAGERGLRLGDRDRRDPAAEVARRVEREPAPARADLEDVLAAAQSGPLGHEPVLVALGVGEGLVGGGVDGGRIGHRLVEEQAEQVVREVVVGGDVPAGAGDRVPAEPVPEGAADLAGHPPPAARERERLPVERCELEEPDEVRCRPAAIDVRLAGARLAVEKQVRQCRVRVEPDLGPPVGGPIAAHLAGAVREDDREAADPDAACRLEPDTPRGAGEHRLGYPPSGRWNRSERSCRALLDLSMAMETDAAPPQPERVQVDRSDRLLGNQRISEQHPRERPVRQGPAPEVHRGREQVLAVLGLHDGDPQPVGLVEDLDLVTASMPMNGDT